MALPIYDLTSVDLATCDLYYGTVMLEDGSLKGVDGDTYFAPQLLLDPSMYYVFEVDYEVVSWDDANPNPPGNSSVRISAYSLREDGDADASNWIYLNQDTRTYAPIGTTGTRRYVVGPGKNGWQDALNAGQNRVVFNGWYVKVTGFRYRPSTSEFPGGVSTSATGKYTYTYIERLRINSTDTDGTDDGYQSASWLCKMTPDTFVAVWWTGDDYHMRAYRVGTDGTITQGPLAVFWAAGEGEFSENWSHLWNPSDPLLPLQQGYNQYGELRYWYEEGQYDAAAVIKRGDDRFVVVSDWDRLTGGESPLVTSATYQLDPFSLEITRQLVHTIPYSYSSNWGQEIKAAPWGDNGFVTVHGDYGAWLMTYDADSGFINHVTLPTDVSTNWDVAVAGDRAVAIRNTDSWGVEVIVYQLGPSGVGGIIGQMTLPGATAYYVGGPFPQVVAKCVGDLVAVITGGPQDTYAKKYGDLRLYWVDPIAMTVSEPVTIVAGTAGQQPLRGGLYLSAYGTIRSLDDAPDGRLLVSWFDRSGNVKAAWVADDEVETFDVIGNPPLLNLSDTTNPRWERVTSLALDNGVVVTMTQGPGYRYAGEGDFANWLAIGFPPQFLRGGFRESRRAFSAT